MLTFQLTYTNNGTEAVETCVCPQLFRMQADGTFPAYTAEAETEYSVDSCDLNLTGEFFSFASSGSHSKNNVLLQPGETQTVTVAFLVDADQLDELYLVPAPHGYESLNLSLTGNQKTSTRSPGMGASLFYVSISIVR